MSIELNPEVAGGTYSNLAIITHSDDEFILDFANMLPGMPKPGVRSRIIMTRNTPRDFSTRCLTISRNMKVISDRST